MDKYKTFRELKENERENVDFVIKREDRDSDVAVIAIHGGKIELGTTEIAKAIAADDLSFYSFEGKKEVNKRDLHITSTHFDEPKGAQFVEKHKTIVSIHGMRGRAKAFVVVGGLDRELREKTKKELKRAGFMIMPAPPGFGGKSTKNICNRGTTGKGVQIEITRKLRDNIISDVKILNKFATAIRTVLL